MKAKEILQGYLCRRGYRVLRINPEGRLVLPAEKTPEALNTYLSLLRRYSFRLVLRDILRIGEGVTPERLSRFAAPAVAAKYLRFLERLGMVEAAGETFRLSAPPPPSFGDTFEWWVAELLGRELHIPACYGVKLAGTRSGGDFDVLAVVEGKLLFVETKISPPKHIHLPEVSAYLAKLGELGPDLSLFVEDTQLRMKDKIVPLFEQALVERGMGLRPLRLAGDIFSLGPRSFILNSRRDLVQNLVFCLRRWLRRPLGALAP